MEKTLKSIATNHGLYLAILSIAILLIMYVTGLEKNWTVSIVSFVLTLAIFILGIITFKKANNGYITTGEAVKIGLGIAVVGGIVAGIYTYLHYSYIQPEFVENIREEAVKQMIERKPDISTEQIEKGKEMTKITTSPFAMSTFTIIGNLILGIITSLITGLIVSKVKE